MTQELALDKLSKKDLSLEEMAHILQLFQGDTMVEATLAMNLSQRTSVYNTPHEVDVLMSQLLERLSHSNDMSARWAVAKNFHTPIPVLEDLSKDSINLVRALVATNPKTPTKILKQLFSDEKIVRDGLSGNPSTPLKYLFILADDTDTMVRLRVVENPSCSKTICEKLSNDDAHNVKTAARIKLKRLTYASV